MSTDREPIDEPDTLRLIARDIRRVALEVDRARIRFAGGEHVHREGIRLAREAARLVALATRLEAMAG